MDRDAGDSYESSSRVAAGGDVIVVGIGNPSPGTHIDAQHRVWDAPTDVTLYFLRATDGKMIARRGPLRGDYFFEVTPTAKGNFLFLLRHLKNPDKDQGETLFLFSSSGEELSKIELARSLARDALVWNTLLFSSSGHTVLVGQTLRDGVHYHILDADSLQSKFAWTAGADSPRIFGISDESMLARSRADDAEKSSPEVKSHSLLISSFGGIWLPFSPQLDLSTHLLASGPQIGQVPFLGDNVVVGLDKGQNPTQQRIRLLRMDGTTVSSVSIPALPEHTWLDGPVLVADQGRYFAVGFRHRPWLTHLMLDVMQMDMAFSDDVTILVVWRTSDLTPVAKIEVGAYPQALSCSPGNPATFAFIDRSELKVVRLLPEGGE